MWARSAQLTGPSSTSEEMGQYRPKMVGPISTQNFSFFFGFGPDKLFWPSPSFMLIICSNVNTYCSRAACNQTVARAADERRRRLPVSVVTDVIKRLS